MCKVNISKSKLMHIIHFEKSFHKFYKFSNALGSFLKMTGVWKTVLFEAGKQQSYLPLFMQPAYLEFRECSLEENIKGS